MNTNKLILTVGGKIRMPHIITKIDPAKPMPPFKYELRQAIRFGSKTETRRVMKSQPHKRLTHVRNNCPDNTACVFYKAGNPGADSDQCFIYPATAGSLRYLREPLVKGKFNAAYYADDKQPVIVHGRMLKWRWKVNKLSQLYMPREAARTFLQLGQLRAERLNQITPASAVAEGIVSIGKIDGHEYFDAPLPMGEDGSPYAGAEMAFRRLWDYINEPRGYGWKINPWVWVIPFKRYAI